MVNHEKYVGETCLTDSKKTAEREMENETLDNSSTSATADFNRGSKLDVSRHEKSRSGDSQDTEDREGIQSMGDQTSGVHFEQSPLEVCIEHNNHSADTCVSTQMGSQYLNVAISPDEVYHFVLVVVEDEMSGDPSYLVSVIVEFLRSVSKEKFKVHSNVYVMTIQLLTHNNRYAELGLFIINKVIIAWPSLFLEAALASSNSEHLAAVLRFFSDFTRGFKGTSEYNRFHRILTEMCLANISSFQLDQIK